MNQNTFSLLDGLRPLSRYLSTSQSEAQTTHHPKNLDQTLKSRSDEMISDWGIDMDSINSPTLVNIDMSRSSLGSLQHASQGLYGHQSDDDITIASPVLPRLYEDNNQFSNSKTNNISITHLLEKGIYKFYETNESFHKFQDELKYILITSQLLDETILISKYKKKISLLQLNHSPQTIVTKFGNTFTNEGSHYIMSGDMDSLTYINLIHFLLHLSKHYQSFSKIQIKTIFIIIIINIYKLSNFKALCYKIIEITILNNMKNFIKNYQRFDISIVKLSNKYKEMTIFPNMISKNIPSNSNNSLKSRKIHDLLMSSVNILTTHIINNIHTIFNSINGPGLENYCGIYNVRLDELNYFLMNDLVSNNQTDYENLVFHLKKFQYLRRFFICCLLSTNEADSNKCEFINNIAKILQIDDFSENKMNVFNSLSTISSTLYDTLQLTRSLDSNIQQFIKMERLTVNSSMNSEGTLLSKVKTTEISEKLSSKLQEIQLNLATLDTGKPIDTQIKDFSKVGELLKSINQQYDQDLANLTNSQNTLRSTKPFNLTPNSSSTLSLSKRKRLSLPPQQFLTPQTRSSPKTPNTPTSSTPKNYKRLSSGLSISLLTVMEDEGDIFDVTNDRKVSYDDNYINITPQLLSPAYLANEPKPLSNNTLQRGQSNYIMENNLLSNDDSVIVTSSTNNSEDFPLESNVLGNDEFKKRLEKNFNRVLSSSTVIGNNSDMIDDDDDDDTNDEINYNNEKIDSVQGDLLMNELKGKFRGTLNV